MYLIAIREKENKYMSVDEMEIQEEIDRLEALEKIIEKIEREGSLNGTNL